MLCTDHNEEGVECCYDWFKDIEETLNDINRLCDGNWDLVEEY